MVSMNSEWQKRFSEEEHTLLKYDFFHRYWLASEDNWYTRKHVIFKGSKSDSIGCIFAFSAPSPVYSLLIFLIQPISDRKKPFNLGEKFIQKLRLFPEKSCSKYLLGIKFLNSYYRLLTRSGIRFINNFFMYSQMS